MNDYIQHIALALGWRWKDVGDPRRSGETQFRFDHAPVAHSLERIADSLEQLARTRGD